MAAISSQPWHLLLHLTLLLLFSFTPFSHTQSDSPRNIETFFPIQTNPSPPPTPLPPPPSTSDKGKIIRAVLITAATTSVVAAAFFFFLQRCITVRRRRDRVSNANSFDSFSFARPATGRGGANGLGATQPVLDREEFTRFNGNVKGLIVDENGLDVLYWRKLHERNKSESFRKEFVNRGRGDYDEEDDKQVIVSKKKQKAQPVQEIPLLRGKSSSSYTPFHQEISDGYSNINSFNTEPKSQPSDLNIITPKAGERSESLKPPPPPPIPAKQNLSPPPPPPPAKFKTGPSPSPPPPPKAAVALMMSSSKPPPVPKSSSVEASSMETGKNGQVKLKPLHWDKVNPDSDHSMVWDKIDHGSFRFDGDLMEALFGYVATNKSSPGKDDNRNPGSSSPGQIYILEPRKSQNTAIMLKSLSISHEELVEALLQGQDFVLDTLERLARIAPTQEEQNAILDFEGDPKALADADAFLFHLLKAIPSAFIRLSALLFKSNYQPEIAYHKKNIDTLVLACKELRARGLFMKLLEATLKAGNRMNAGTARGNAQAFNLTALRKLSDVKSVDGKTTLLHFVVEQVVRSEGKRCAMNKKNVSLSRSSSSKNGSTSTENSNASEDEQEKEYVKLGLPVVGGLSAEFSYVKKAAAIDYEAFSATCSALYARAKDTRRALGQCERDGGEFISKMLNFVDSADEEVQGVREDQIKATDLVKRTTEYYQAGALNDKNPLQLFVIIKDFLGMVDKVCLEIARNLQKKRPGALGSPLQKNAVKFPVLPPNFMSDRSRSNSSGSDNNL